MRPRSSISPVVFISAIALLSACAKSPPQERPDLIPERISGSEGAVGFCRRDAGNLIVRVRNQTNQDVLVQTVTVVTFPPNPPVSQPTAPMPGGSFTDVAFAIPAGCFNPDCGFTIEVDANDDVDESHGDQPDNHEANNAASGICIG